MLELKLQYFGHLMCRTDSLEKTLKKSKGRRRRGRQRMRWLYSITDLIDTSLGKLGIGDGQGGLACYSPWGRKKSDTTDLLNWSELKVFLPRWKRLWCWERLKAGGERDDRGWDVWMASLTQWIWVWESVRSWWWTGKSGILQSTGVTKSWTQLNNWTKLNDLPFPGDSDGKEFAYNAGDLGSIPGFDRSPGERMATHSRILSWRIPWIEEPSRLQSVSLKIVRPDRVTDTHIHRIFL